MSNIGQASIGNFDNVGELDNTGAGRLSAHGFAVMSVVLTVLAEYLLTMMSVILIATSVMTDLK